MSGFLGWDSSYNPFELDELTYVGKLYHYRGKNGFNSMISANGIPEGFKNGCISLRFSRIESMRKNNDNKERLHIIGDIQKVILYLNKTERVSNDFAKKVGNYISTDEGFSSIKTDKFDDKFHLPIIRWDTGKVNYYVACFSVNPNNLHNVNEFCAPYRISFKSEFSLQKNNELYPFSILNDCSLYYSIKRVVYEDDDKKALLERMLMETYRNFDLSHPDGIDDDLQTIYSLYEAFFKSVDYIPEDEVRFVIRLSEDFDSELLKKKGICFDDNKEHLFLPVDKKFIDSYHVADGEFKSISGDPMSDFFPSRPTAIGGMTREQLDAEIQKGFDSMTSEKTYTADEIDAMFLEEYGVSITGDDDNA